MKRSDDLAGRLEAANLRSVMMASYTADAGEEYLNVTVSYRFRYLGV